MLNYCLTKKRFNKLKSKCTNYYLVNKSKMKRLIKNSCALITGGAGFIGSHLADELIKNKLVL